MKNHIELMRKRLWAALAVILLPTAIIALTCGQIIGKPYYTLGDKGCSTLSAAITTIGTTPATLIVPAGKWAADGLTVPTTLKLVVEKGGLLSLTVAAGNFTINGPLDAGQYRIFTGAQIARLRFGPGVAPEYPVRWWGAVGDGTTDDTKAIQSAITNAQGYSSTKVTSTRVVGTPRDIYLVSSLNYAPSTNQTGVGGRVTFDGKNATLLKKRTGDSNTHLLKIKYGNNIEVCNWNFVGGIGNCWSAAYANGEPAAVTFNLTGLTVRVSAPAKTFTVIVPSYFSWARKGVAVGSSLTFSGFGDGNDGAHTVTKVSGTTITCSAAAVTESKASITCTITGNKKTSLEAMTSNFDWYWLSNVLYIKDNLYASDASISVASSLRPQDMFTIKADNTTVTAFTIYTPGDGLLLYQTTNARVRDCSFGNFDKALRIDGAEWCTHENLTFGSNKYNIWLERVAGSRPHHNKFIGINGNPTYRNAVHMNQADECSFDACAFEANGGSVFVVDTCNSLKINNIRVEGTGQCFQGNADGAGYDAHFWSFTNVHGLSISASKLISEGFKRVTSLFWFDGVWGAKISANWIYVPGNGLHQYVYQYSGHNSGISFENNAFITTSYVQYMTDKYPIAVFRNNHWDKNTPCVSAIPMLEVRPNMKEYCLSPTVTGLVGTIAKTGSATTAWDSTFGYDDTASWKTTWGAIAETATWSGFATNPGGSTYYYCVLSCALYTDTPQRVGVGMNNGPGSKIYINNDGWYYFQVRSQAMVGTTSHANLTLSAIDSASGNVWVDRVSVKYFKTMAEANAWMGCIDIASATPVALLP